MFTTLVRGRFKQDIKNNKQKENTGKFYLIKMKTSLRELDDKSESETDI